MILSAKAGLVSTGRDIILTAACGLLFWMPDIILHRIRSPMGFNSTDAVLLTTVEPLFTYFLFRLLSRKVPRRRLAFHFLLGMWILGGLVLVGNAALDGNHKLGLRDVLVFTLPFALLSGASVEGSGIGLIIVTVVLFFEILRKRGVTKQSEDSGA